MRTVRITFFGYDLDIRITHNGGYEHDTNAHSIEWEWCDEEMNQFNLSAEEEQDIMDQIYQSLDDWPDYDDYCL